MKRASNRPIARKVRFINQESKPQPNRGDKEWLLDYYFPT